MKMELISLHQPHVWRGKETIFMCIYMYMYMIHVCKLHTCTYVYTHACACNIYMCTNYIHTHVHVHKRDSVVQDTYLHPVWESWSRQPSSDWGSAPTWLWCSPVTGSPSFSCHSQPPPSREDQRCSGTGRHPHTYVHMFMYSGGDGGRIMKITGSFTCVYMYMISHQHPRDNPFLHEHKW